METARHAKLLILLFGLCVVHQEAVAEIYRCVDRLERTYFKDAPCDTNETLVMRIETTPTPTSAQRSTPTPLGRNLLKNPGFEDKLVDWRVPLGAAWTSNGGFIGSGALIIQAATPPDDKYIHETTAEQCVLLPAGEKYQLKARFMFDRLPLKAVANRANVIWYESTDCTAGGQWGGYIEPQNILGWQELSRERLTPALGARAAKITIVQNGRYSNNGTAYWDDIEFSPTEIFERSAQAENVESHSPPIAAGHNYVANGAFNGNLTPWRNGWPTTHEAFIGSAAPGAAKVTASSTGSSIGRHALSQCVNLEGAKQLELGASFKRDETSTQDGGGRLRLTWYELQNCQGRAKTDTKSSDPKKIDGWQKLQIAGLVAPDQSRSAKIEIIQSVAGAGEFRAYWDDVYLESAQPTVQTPSPN